VDFRERKDARLALVMFSRSDPFGPTQEGDQLEVCGEIAAFKPFCVLHGRELRTLGSSPSYLVSNDACREAAVTREQAAEDIEPVCLGERAEHHRVEDETPWLDCSATHGVSPSSMAAMRSSALI
jgi:hypothetical protein